MISLHQAGGRQEGLFSETQLLTEVHTLTGGTNAPSAQSITQAREPKPASHSTLCAQGQLETADRKGGNITLSLSVGLGRARGLLQALLPNM